MSRYLFAVTLLLCLAAQAQGLDLNQALVNSAKSGNTNVVQKLLDQGANPNSFDSSRFSALHWAVEKSKSDMVKLLLAKGATVDVRDQYGCTPLHRAAGNQWLFEMMPFLIDAGADINARNKKQQTPLDGAVKNQWCSKSVNLLLSKGADVNIQDSDGRTPVMSAVIKGGSGGGGNLAILGSLLKSGRADLSIRDKSGRTAMDWASKENIRALELLLDYGGKK